MSASFKADLLITATVKLTDITEEAYRDILAYIEQRIAVPVVEPKAESEVEKQVEEKKEAVPEVKATDKPGIASDLDALYLAYANDSNRAKHYILMEMTASQFVEKHPEYKGLSAKGAGKYLNAVCQRYAYCVPEPVKRTMRVDENNSVRLGAIRVYCIPKRITTTGDVIRTLIRDLGLDIRDFAEKVNYARETIELWARDEMPMSDNAKRDFCRMFGSHLFDNVTIKNAH